MPTVNAHALAAEMDLSVARVHQLVGLGMPKASRGKFDLITCLKWLCRYQRDLIAKREDGTGAADLVRKERAELIRVQREAQELDLARKCGELIPIATFSATMSEMILTARQRLLQLPGRVAPELENEPRVVIKHKLTLAIHDALNALANGDDPEDPPADPEAKPNGHANGKQL